MCWSWWGRGEWFGGAARYATEKAYIDSTHIVGGKSYVLAYFKSEWCRADLAAEISFRV